MEGWSYRSQAHGSLVWALREYAEIAERVVDLSGAKHGLHRTDMRTLSLLMRRQAQGIETTPSDLSKLLGLSSASTTALVDRLVHQGHAERARSERDRRSVEIFHTDSAATEGREVFQPIASHTALGLEGFTDEELAIAERVLRSVTRSLLEVEEQLREERP